MERKNEIDEKNIPNNKSLFPEITGGKEGSKIELFSRRFDKNDKSLSFGIVGSSPASSAQRDIGSFLIYAPKMGYLKKIIPKNNKLCWGIKSGEDGTRTHDLLTASQAL